MKAPVSSATSVIPVRAQRLSAECRAGLVCNSGAQLAETTTRSGDWSRTDASDFVSIVIPLLATTGPPAIDAIPQRKCVQPSARVSLVRLARRAAAQAAGPGAAAPPAGTLKIGGDLLVNRMGFGAMRLTGPGIWGEPRDAAEARRVLRRALELGVNFIDTADAYGPEVSERLIKEALHP